MAWDREHKATTHKRIVETAAAALRRHGLAGVGVVDIMKEAGLTHGGFYAHFGSKDALVAEALAEADAQTAAWLDKAAATAAPAEKLLAVAEAYLSRLHREHPERGCPVAALGAEALRGDGPSGAALAERIRARLKRLETLAPAPGAADRRTQAVGALAAMIGGMILARGARDPAESERTLAAVRRFLRRALAPPARRSRPPRTSQRKPKAAR